MTPHSSYVQNEESVSDDSIEKSHFQDSHLAMNCECNTVDVNKDDPLDSNMNSSGDKSKFKVNPNLSLLNSCSHVLLTTGDLCVFNNSVFVVDWVVHNTKIAKVKYAIKRPETRPFIVSHHRVSILDDQSNMDCSPPHVFPIQNKAQVEHNIDLKREKREIDSVGGQFLKVN